MADITISDLELAPALTDDMVLPVENTKNTYAATLAMLRRQINKTFVEVENADFNALIDDGFYQCTGTPTNSPVAGAINWTLQVSAESGVVVQRAFSLDDNFANMYIRRWNGVTWTGWIEVGAGALNKKANISLSNLDATGQAKFDAKANIDLNNLSTAGQAIINGKADINANNFTATGKETVVGWAMPNYSAGVNMGAGKTHTATKKGWVMFETSSIPGNGVIQINGIEFSRSSVGSYGTAYDTVQEFIPVDVGNTFFITNNATAVCIFFPCKGV